MTNLLLTIIAAIVKALLPAAIDAARPTAQDAKPQPELRRKLSDRIRRHWPAALLLLGLLLAGCTRTIYVPHGQPVRLRETIHDAQIWTVDENGQPVAGQMDLPEGWYCLPLDPVDSP